MQSIPMLAMLCNSVFCLIVLVSVVTAESAAYSCPPGADGISCLGRNIARNVVREVLDLANFTSPQHLWQGIEFIPVPLSDGADVNSSNSRDLSTSLLSSLRKLISSYEIRVRLPELIRGIFNEQVAGRKGGGFGGLGGDKGGGKGGGLMMMMMMMGGMMKMMALGALGMLAMKALTVSSLAFLLSAVVGLKKLLSKGDDDDGGHHVQVVGGGGHGGSDHHRRSLGTTLADELAYRGQIPQ